MVGLVARRLALALPTLFGITLLTFAIMHLAPGGPVGAGDEPGGVGPTAEALARFRAAARLDEPVWKQYLIWAGGLLRGDLGLSLYDGEPVARKILGRLPATLVLALSASLLAWSVAVPLGIAASLRPGSPFDRATGVFQYGLHSLPTFWSGLLLQGLFAVHLGWLPLQGVASDGAAGWALAARVGDRLAHIALPAVCLAGAQVAFLSRFIRAAVVEQSGRDYVRTARAKGLSETGAALRHALPNALLPLLTLIGLTLPALAAGAVIVERVFSWPGAGRLLLESIHRRDYTTLMGLTLLGALLTQAGTLLSDVLVCLADPRIRRGAGAGR